MSSLAAAQADGYYYPPDFDPKRHKTVNNYRGSHALGVRAKKLKSHGVLVIRFEMPYHVTCLGKGGKCGHTIGKGVRFNAEKKCVGMYHTTKIWSFVMRTPCCQSEIEVRTDPKATDYIMVRGARRKAESAGASGVQMLDLPDEFDKERREDPFARLERDVERKTKVLTEGERLRELEERSGATTRDDYSMNKALRQKNREKRNQEKSLRREADGLGLSKSISLLPASSEDHTRAATAILQGRAAAKPVDARRRIRNESIFAQAVPSSSKGRKTLTRLKLRGR